jgi:glucosamine--fructose-6-phosphate aminotransferase (isomerizing)
LPIAHETALKLKEASYLHAEGFAAGEFRHGSVAMVDASCAVLGIVDADALDIVARPLRDLAKSDALLPSDPRRSTRCRGWGRSLPKRTTAWRGS